MADPRYLETPRGRRIAYHKTEGQGPGVVFLGGLVSDMEGTKALYLEDWAKAQGRAYLRFDYSGHGLSSGAFEDGTIGAWAEDAVEAIARVTEGPQVLVGSSLGGWISLLVARRMPERVAGLVTIAAAPDFTEDSMWSAFTDAQRAEYEATGRIVVPSDYSDDGYVVTKGLIESGRENLVLRSPMNLPFPVRFLQGTEDVDVPPTVALRLLDHATGEDLHLRLVKGADHRFSTPECLGLIVAGVEEVLKT